MVLFTAKDNNVLKIKEKPTSNTYNDCLCCVMRIIIRIGCLLGTSPIICECDHSKTYFQQQFSTSTLYFLLSISYLVTLICSFRINIYYLFEKNNTKTRIQLLQIIVLLLLELAVIGDFLLTIFKLKTRKKELNSLISIINNRQNYGVKEIFSQRNRKYLRSLSRIYLFIVLFITIVCSCQILIRGGKQENENSFHSVIASSLCLIILVTHMFQLTFKQLLLKTILNSIYNVFRNTLEKRLLTQNNIILKNSYLQNLRQLQKMYCAVILSCKSFNNFLNPFLLYQFIINIILAIMGYYLLTVTWILRNERETLSFITEFGLCTILIMVVYILSIVDSLYNSVSILYTL